MRTWRECQEIQNWGYHSYLWSDMKNILDPYFLRKMGWIKPKKPFHATVPLRGRSGGVVRTLPKSGYN
jgi:hypothetical protein